MAGREHRKGCDLVTAALRTGDLAGAGLLDFVDAHYGVHRNVGAAHAVEF